MKKILVATDLSERSDRAVRRALRLAALSGAECHVLFVVDDSLPQDIAQTLLKDAGLRLRRFLDAAPGGGAAAQDTAVLGDPITTVCDKAAELGADLVVLGLHRPRPFLDALRETTMERLVRLLRLPVLLVRDPADHDYQSVLAAVSFSPACAAALRAARWVAPSARISAFHANLIPFAGFTGEGPGSATARQMAREAEAACEEWAGSEALPADLAEVEIVTGSLGQVFERQLRTTGADLVALGAHTRSVYLASSLGSFAAELIRNPPTDLLIARRVR
ncbi:MAG: universal stress protein [Paracoccaceae bacterium]|nr:universal stress protein [Paracoccaceae bacterium]